MQRTRSRTLAFRLLALAAGCFFAVLLVELVLRLQPAPPKPDKQAEIGKKHRLPGPDFRGRPLEEKKEPGVFRILIVGDSYTWGYGLYEEDSYPNVLERRLRVSDPRVRYEVVPWSLPGWNTNQEVQSLAGAFSKWSPDLLIIGFVLNDAEPTLPRDLLPIRTSLERRMPASRLGRWFYDHSRMVHRAFESAENRRMRRALIAYYRNLYQGEFWEACQKALARLRNMARSQEIPSLLVIFPIFDSPVDHRYSYRDLHELVAKTAQDLELDTLDLLPAYQGIDGRRLALEPYTDPHPSTLGHMIAADTIFEYLIEHQLVPASKRLRHRPVVEPRAEAASQ